MLRMVRNVIVETAIGSLNRITWYAATAREQGEAILQVMWLMAPNVIVTTQIGLFQMTDGFVLIVKGHAETSPFEKEI